MEEPKPKKKWTRWVVLYGVAGIVDIVQFLLFWTGIGIGINEALEAYTGPILIVLFILFKIAIFNKPKRIGSLLAFLLGDAITGGIAPFWIADVFYIHRDVIKEGRHEALEKQQLQFLSSAIKNRKRNVNGIREAFNPEEFARIAAASAPQASNFNGTRRPEPATDSSDMPEASRPPRRGDLIVPEESLGLSENLIRSMGEQFRTELYTQRQKVGSGYTPASFFIVLRNLGKIDEVFNLLRSNRIPVKYGGRL